MSSGFYAKFFSFHGYSIIRAALHPLLFGSMCPFTFCSCQCTSSTINSPFDQISPFLSSPPPFLTQTWSYCIIYFTNVWSFDDLSLSFPVLMRTFYFVSIFYLQCISCYSHVSFIFMLTMFAMTGQPRVSYLGEIPSSSTPGHVIPEISRLSCDCVECACCVM
jgi:hypothetical protein